MNTQDEWTQWRDSWQRQPVVDVHRLRRQVRHKRWRMFAMVAFEAVSSLFALVQTAWLMQHPLLGLRWKIFSVGAMVLILALWALSLGVRRGTWRASGDRVDDLLRLTAHRARAGIRLGWVGLYGLAVLLVFVIALAWPQLQPASWQHDVRLRFMLAVQIAFNGPVVLATVTFNLWYIRRQRRRLARITQLLGEQDAPD